MPKIALDTIINDLVDSVYEAFDIDEEWTSAMHRRATDKIKRHAKELAKTDLPLSEAVGQAISADTNGNEAKFAWLSGRLDEAFIQQSIDPNFTEADAKRAHFEKIDNERAQIANHALAALHGNDLSDLQANEQGVARLVILFYMNARAAYNKETNSRTSLTKVAAEKAKTLVLQQYPDLNADELRGLESSLEIGQSVLLSAIKAHREAKPIK